MKRRHRSRRSKVKSKSINIGKKLFPIAKGLAAPTSFLEQITAKDRQVLGSAYATAPTTQKVKILSNIVTGRLTGINLFSDEYQAPQTINPAGILNKWTNAGGIMIAYNILGSGLNKSVGKSIAPATGKIGSIGKQLAIGGGIGGFFDDPVATGTTRKVSGTRALSPQVSSPMVVSASGGDSSESGF